MMNWIHTARYLSKQSGGAKAKKWINDNVPDQLRPALRKQL